MIEYKLVYKMSGTVWKHFIFDADNDQAAAVYAGKWVGENHAIAFCLYKITTERLI